ncbi:MAG: polymer-forming cytoskeletal protein [Oscillospiraceae bacterium]|nr:polymer-forming cytoskeletal protein [Oscillospiraceae bacterium]
MSLKDNFNQAVKEILRKDGLVGDDLSKESKKKSELDRYIDSPRADMPAQEEQFVSEQMTPEYEPEPIVPDISAAEATEPEPAASPYVQNAQASQFGTRPSYPQGDPFGGASGGYQGGAAGGYSGSAGGFPGSAGGFSGSAGGFPGSGTGGYPGSAGGYPGGTGGYPGSAGGYPGSGSGGYPGNAGGYPGSTSGYMGGLPPVPPMPPIGGGGGGGDVPYYETEETTVISRNTLITGDIRSFANVNIDGSVKGNIKITKNINITGKVVGDVECSNSVMTGASMQGSIASKGQVQLDRDTILLGDISAQYLDLNGKIKGNVDIGGKAEFKTDAIVMGNITASTITVLDGATIQGYVNTTFLQETTSTIFPDAIAVSD